jgi:hypothetical protein
MTRVLQLPTRLVVNPDARPPAPPAYRPRSGFLLDAPVERLPDRPRKGYAHSPRMAPREQK